MTTQIKVLRENIIKSLSGIKEDNVSIADVTINRRKLLAALKLQTQPDADMLTLTYGKVTWQDKYKISGYHSDEWQEVKVVNETCVQFSCNHTTMHFLNRPKERYGQEPKIIPLNFIDLRNMTKAKLSGVPIDPQEFIKALSFVLPCVAGEQTRPVLNCILFESGNDSIRFIAADGFRLGIDKIQAPGIPQNKVLITLVDIARLLTFLKAIKPIGRGKGKYYPDVYLSYASKSIKFATESGYIKLDKQAGTFPNYAQLVPKDGAKIEFIASDMLEAVKALKNIANDGSGIIRLHFTTGKPSRITLSAKSEEVGESSIDCDAIVESDCMIAINNRYLLDLLNLCKDSQVIMKVKHDSSPGLFLIGDNRQYVIMPMFVQW